MEPTKNNPEYRITGIIISGLVFIGLVVIICANISQIVEAHAADVRKQEVASRNDVTTQSQNETPSPSPALESSPTPDSSTPTPLASAQPTQAPTPSPQPSDPIPSPSPDPSESSTPPPTPTATPEPVLVEDYAALIKRFWDDDDKISTQLNNDMTKIATNAASPGGSRADALTQEGTLMHRGAERMRGNLDLVRRLTPPQDLRNWHERMCVDYDQVAGALDAAANGADGNDVTSFEAGADKVKATQGRWKEACSELLHSAGYDAEVFEASHRLTKSQ